MEDQAVTDSQFVIVDFKMPLTNGHFSSSGLWQMQVQCARSKNKCIQMYFPWQWPDTTTDRGNKASRSAISIRAIILTAFFLGATAVLHHLGNLQSSLNKGYLGHSNLKTESVKADCNNDYPGHSKLEDWKRQSRQQRWPPFAGLRCGSVLPMGDIDKVILAADRKLCETPRLSRVRPEDGGLLWQVEGWFQWLVGRRLSGQLWWRIWNRFPHKGCWPEVCKGALCQSERYL